MVRTLSLTTSQIDALSSSNDTILYNAQQRAITLYGGTDLASNITQLEINNDAGNCLKLRYDSDTNKYVSFNLDSSGTLNVNVNGGDKSFNIVNHNGTTQGLMLNGDLVVATAYEINQLSGLTASLTSINKLDVTAGTASAGKALVTDSNNNISGINDLSTNNLTVNGTLVTASATELNYTDIATAGTAQAAKALIVDTSRNITNINNLTASQLTGTLQTASQPNITSVGTLGDLTVTNEITTDTINVSSLILDGVNISTTISNANGLDGITAGTVSAGKAMVVDSSKNLTGMGNLTSTGTITASTLTGTVSTASQPNITSVGTLSSLSVSGNISGTLSTAAQGNITSVGTLNGLVASGDVNISSHNGTTTGLKLNGTLVTAQASDLNKLPDITATASELNYLSGVTSGVVSASHALVVDGNKDINGIRNVVMTGSITGSSGVSATTLTGTLATASQPNITSVGTLGDLTVTNEVSADTLSANSLILNGVDITTALNNSNGLDGVTAGTVTASKVLIVDSNKDLTGMGNLTSTGTITASTLAGTLSTASQPNITSVGTLSSLTIANNGNVTMSGTGTLTGAASVSATNLTGTLQTAAQTNITSVGSLSALTIATNGNVTMSGTGTITGAASVSATNLTGTLQTASQPNITSVGTLNGLITTSDVDISSHNGTTTGLKLNGTLVTAGASEINTLTGVTAGTVSASKSVVVDSNKDLTGMRNITLTGTLSGVTTLTATNVAGTLSTASQPNITTLAGVTSVGASGSTTLTGTLQTAVQPNITTLAGVTSVGASGSTTLTGTLQTAAQPNITTLAGVTSVGASGSTTLTGTLQTAAQPNITTLAGVTSVGASGSTTLTGTLQTAAQPNITSVGTLSSLNLSGALSGVTTLTATTLAGTLSTASQPNITSVGTLSSLTLSGALSGVTTLNNSGIITNTSNTASTNNATGALKLAGGIAISNTTDSASSTNGGTFTSAGGGAFAKALYVGTYLSVGTTLTVNSDLTVGGNLIVSGTTTSVNSTSTTILDNTLLLNSGPSGTGYDSGVITKRYQVSNALGTGDVVTDTAKETYTISSATTTTITLPSGANTNDNYYNNWWIKIGSGSLNNQVRQISGYVGSTKVLTLSSALTGTPTSSDTIYLYNKAFTSLHWNESNKRFTTAFTANDTTTNTLNIIDYADFATNNIIGLSSTTSTNNTTGALKLAGGIGISNTTDATSSTNGGTFTSAGGGAFAKALYVGTTLTANTLVGTLSTAAQPNITSIGTLTSLTLSGSISGVTTLTATNLSGTLTAGAQNNITTLTGATSVGQNSSTVLTGTLATVSQGNITTLAGLTSFGTSSITTNMLGNLSVAGTLAGTLTTGAQNNITTLTGATSVGQNSSTILTGTLATVSQGNITTLAGLTSFGTSTVTTNMLGNLSVAGTLAGTLTAGAQNNITTLTGATSVGQNSSTVLTGTLATASQGNITTLAGLTSFGTSSITTNMLGNLSVAGTLTGTLTAGAQNNITTLTGATSVGASGSTTLTGTLQTSSQPNITTLAGITSIGASNSTTLTGTLQTALQPNITTLDGVTSIGSYGTFLYGILYRADQPNITSVGTLSSLTLSGALSGATTIGASGNVTIGGGTSGGVLSISNTTGSTSASTGALKVAGGAGFGGNTFIGGNLSISGSITSTSTGLNLPAVNVLGLNGTLSNTLLNNWTTSAVAKNYTSGCWSPELGVFVVTNSASTSTIYRSTDGATWYSLDLSTTFTALSSVCWSPDLMLFMAVGTGSSNTHYTTSSDGISWSSGTVPAVTGLSSVCWSSELKLFVATSLNGYVVYSSNGLSYAASTSNWSITSQINSGTVTLSSIIWCKEKSLFIITNAYTGAITNGIYTSPDAISWTVSTTPSTTGGLSYISWSKELSLFVATGNATNSIMYSSNSFFWTMVSSLPTMVGGYRSVSWIPELNRFIAVGGSTATNGNNYSISYDGTTWSSTSYTSTYADVRSCIIWSPDLSLIVIPSSNASSSYPMITSTQNANSSLNIISNTINSISSKLGTIASTQLVNSSGLNGTIKWANTTTTTQTNELMRLSKDGFLGINTKTPAQLLHLTAVSSTNNKVIRLSNPGNNYADIAINTNGSISISSSNTKTLVGLYINSTETSGRYLSIMNSSIADGQTNYVCFGKATIGNQQAELGYTHAANGTASNLLTFGFYGNSVRTMSMVANCVGINMASSNNNGVPSYPFQVANSGSTNLMTIDSSGNLAASNRIGINLPSTYNSNTGAPLYVLDFGSNGSPYTMPINLYAGLRGFGPSASALNYISDNSHKWWYQSTSISGTATGAPSGTNTMTLSTNGNLQIVGTLSQASDYRIKENVVNLTYGIYDIKKIRPVKYNMVGNNEECVGFIAHELQEIIPELVSGVKDGIDEEGEYITQKVNYSQLTAILVKGMQEQNEIIDELKNKNNDLESRLSILENFINNTSS